MDVRTRRRAKWITRNVDRHVSRYLGGILLRTFYSRNEDKPYLPALL